MRLVSGWGGCGQSRSDIFLLNLYHKYVPYTAVLRPEIQDSSGLRTARDPIMIALARLLVQDRWRKLNRHYGSVQYGSTGLMVLIFGWLGATSAVPYVRRATASRLEAWMAVAWVSWALCAAVTGKDLSWRIGLERIRAFRTLGFHRLYFLTFILGFLSLPLLAGFAVIPYWLWVRGLSRFSDTLGASVGYGLFVSSVRLTGSLGRSVLHFGKNLPCLSKQAAALLVGFLAALTLISFLYPQIEVPHPGRLFGQYVSGKARVYPLGMMSCWVLMLVSVDFFVRRNLTYSSVQWVVPGFRLFPFSSMFSLPASWPGPLFRIGILGWLRSRTAFTLFLWGSGYSVLWTCFSKPKDVSYFFLFAFMNLVFHCYLRGNLLGIDRGAAWFYYLSPIPIERIVSSKSLSLSLVQGCMIVSLFGAGFLQTHPLIKPLDWLALSSYAISAIVLGEICGFFFSILYPESIDRTSQFDGGATVGNIASGALQFLFMILFLRVYRNVQRLSGSCCGLFLTVPLCLWMIRSVVLKTWVHKAMWAKREAILKKLMWF